MAAALDVRQKQRTVIEYLCCENVTVENIHERLIKAYGDHAVDRCILSRYASRLFGENEQANIRNFPLNGKSHSAQTLHNMQRINNLVLIDIRVWVKEFALQVEVDEACVCRILKQYSRKRFVPDRFRGYWRMPIVQTDQRRINSNCIISSKFYGYCVFRLRSLSCGYHSTRNQD